MKSMSLHLLRHGSLQTAGLFCANEDEPLSTQGLADLFKTVKTSGVKYDVIVSSPFVRCANFSQQLSKQSNIPLSKMDGFGEMDFGDWKGQTTDRLWEREATQFEKLWQSPEDFIAPQGESVIAFSKRIEEGLESLIKEYQNQSILLVTHAGVIRSILMSALGLSYQSALRFDISYASMTTLHHYSDGVYSLKSLACRGGID